jgi:hypothetical protein
MIRMNNCFLSQKRCEIGQARDVIHSNLMGNHVGQGVSLFGQKEAVIPRNGLVSLQQVKIARENQELDILAGSLSANILSILGFWYRFEAGISPDVSLFFGRTVVNADSVH